MDRYSDVVIAFKGLSEKINENPDGLFEHRVIIQTGNVKIDNNEIDCEFDIPFDDDTEANEAEIVIYNLKDSTINQFKTNQKITVTAGYGKDTGIIFSGYISHRNTITENCEKKTTVYALDNMNLQERDIESITYSENTKASYILKNLCQKVGLPIVVFEIVRDHTYTDSVTVDGGLMDNIRKYAKICGVSAYICKSAIYVRSVKSGDNTRFTLSNDTGLISVSEFEEQDTNEKYTDKIVGYDVEMLLQHRVQTASIITLKTQKINGTYRVREGRHEYDGTNFTTKVKVI